MKKINLLSLFYLCRKKITVPLLLTLLTISNASASCFWVNGGSFEAVTVSFGDISVPRNTPVGRVIATRYSSQVGFNNGAGMPAFGCDTQWDYSVNPEMYATPSSLGNFIYNTSVPGLGIRISNYYGYAVNHNTRAAGFLQVWDRYTIDLIKTSNQRIAGALNGGMVARTGARNWFYASSVSITGSNVTSSGCSLRSTAIAVDMGRVSVRQFTGVGSTSDSKDVSIGLECEAGTQVSITLEGTAADGGAPGVLALNAGSVATGVGVQLLNNNTPIALGTETVIATVGAEGDYNMTLYARYYQTRPEVTAGSANSTATFTMSYN